MVRQTSPCMVILLVASFNKLPSCVGLNFFCVNRTCNRVANALASRTSVGLDLQFWLEDCPGDIAPLVFADVP